MLRRTRIVCVSDTHNASPATGAFALPKGDVLIHAGDLTKQGTLRELQQSIAWIDAADYEAKIVIAGNHDITLDPAFYAQYGAHFHNQHPQDVEACRRVLQDAPSITYLEDSAAEIRLTRPSGPRTRFRVFGSPRSPAQRDGKPWAFQYAPEAADAVWARIPLAVDLVVTHAPPRLHCDDGAGCEALRAALWRVRPRLAVCGHVHTARGAARVPWDLDGGSVRFKEHESVTWEDASRGSKKQALLDLTGRKGGGEPLRNDGAHPAVETDGKTRTVPSPSEAHAHSNATPSALPASDGIRSAEGTARGLGGRPPSGRCDVAALHGRLGRLETCVVNASIMASSFPYKGTGAERYNKPIVVDLDLPAWDGNDEESSAQVLLR